MDVRLPNGTVIRNVPDGMSKADLMAKLKVGGHDVDSLLKPIAPVTAAPAAPAAPMDVPQSMLSRAGGVADMLNPLSLTNVKSNIKALGNAPASAKKFAGGVVEAVTNPVETAKTLGSAVLGGIVNATGMSIPKQNPFDMASPDDPVIAKAVQTANAIGGDYKAAYGSPEAIRRTYETDPVRVMADMSMLASGGGGLAKVGGLTQTGAGLSAAATAIDPIMVAARGAGATLRGGARLVEPFTNSRIVAGRALVNSMSNPQAVVNALEATRGERATPGYTPTLSERLVGQGVNEPGVAGTEVGLYNTSQRVGREVFAQREQNLNALTNQLARIEDQLTQRATAATPQGLQDLAQTRNQLLRRINTEQADLARQGVDLAGTLPNVGQRGPGQALITRAGELEEGVRATRIRPAYANAYALAGDTPIDISGVTSAAEDILGRTLSTFDPSTVSRTARELARLSPTEVTVSGSEFPTGVSGGGGTVTLQQLDDIRKAINADIGDAMAMPNVGTAGIQLRNLNQLHAVLDQAVARSGLTDEAKAAYTNAVGRYREEFVPQFKTGIPADIRRTSRRNESGVLPDAVVQKFLGSERGAEQFTNLFRGDPNAAANMAAGVLDLFRTKVIDKTTRMVNPAMADAFVKQYGDNLDVLQQAGVDIRGGIDAVRNEATRLQGAAGELGDLQTAFRAPESAAELVDAALKSPKLLGNAINRLNPDGRAAFGGALTNRVLDMIKAGEYDAALTFLTKNETALRTGLGRTGPYGDLVDMATAGRDLAAVSKTAPEAITRTTAQDLSAFSDAELTDLVRAAEDIRRYNVVQKMATTGSRPGPAYVAGSEAAKSLGTAAEQAPQSTNRVATIGRNIAKRAENRISKKAAARLAYVMYTNPNAAISLINDTLAKSRPIKVPDLRAATAAGQLNNAMSPENRNAMAR